MSASVATNPRSASAGRGWMRGKRQAEAKGRKSAVDRFVPFFELAFHDVVLSNPDKITQEVRQVIELSESTLYPVLRRLQKDECLEVYDRECSGRTRRYYKVTSRGWAQLHLYESEWRSYSDKITGLFEGKLSDRSEA